MAKKKGDSYEPKGSKAGSFNPSSPNFGKSKPKKRSAKSGKASGSKPNAWQSYAGG